MADISVKVLIPAASYDLASLAEIKTMLGLSTADTSEDALLQVWISNYSDIIATMCHRVFAKEKVIETWRGDSKPLDSDNGRVFLTHYPVADADLLTVTGPDGTTIATSGYELENASGKLQFFNATWSEPVRITYTGGYLLPTNAPPALKQALGLLVQYARIWQSRALTSGVRSISHRESRVQFFDINAAMAKMAGGAGPLGMAHSMVMPLLSAYMRYYV
jgi:hypothetical protein